MEHNELQFELNHNRCDDKKGDLFEKASFTVSFFTLEVMYCPAVSNIDLTNE